MTWIFLYTTVNKPAEEVNDFYRHKVDSELWKEVKESIPATSKKSAREIFLILMIADFLTIWAVKHSIFSQFIESWLLRPHEEDV